MEAPRPSAEGSGAKTHTTRQAPPSLPPEGRHIKESPRRGATPTSRRRPGTCHAVPTPRTIWPPQSHGGDDERAHRH